MSKSFARSFLALSLLLVLIVAALPALADDGPVPQRAAPGWQELSPPPANRPSERSDHAMAYDVDRGRGVLFGGGSSNSTMLGDTWEFSSATGEWIEKTPVADSPPPRMWHVMVYDEARHLTTLFGGYDINTNTYYNDTWIWDGEEWTELTPASPPPALHLASATYDAQRQVLVVFGGYHVGYRNETYEWDGTDWQLVSNDGPAPRGGAYMAYDRRRQVHVLFGGVNLFNKFQDTWEMSEDGVWEEITPPQSPERRSRGGAVYLPQIRRTFLYGGLGATYLEDVFVWKGEAWATRAFAPTPAARCCFAMVYDPVLKGVLVFGGATNIAVQNDTWLFR